MSTLIKSKLVPASSFKQHFSAWKDCTRCRLHTSRLGTALYRGVIPCQVLFIGEAPGISEDALQVPFIGPAGRLLDAQIKEAEEAVGHPLSKLWTNLVGCIPKVENTNRKAEEPLPDEIEACSPRLRQLFTIAKPKLIVAVGLLSEKQAKIQEWNKVAKVITINQPAGILRTVGPQQELDSRRVVIQLSTAFEELTR